MKYLPDSNRGVIDNPIPMHKSFQYPWTWRSLFMLQCLSVRTTSTFMLCSSANVVTQSIELRWIHFHILYIQTAITWQFIRSATRLVLWQVKFNFAETLSCFCLFRKTSNFFYSVFCDSDLLLISFPPRMQPFCMALEWYTSTITPFSGEYK